MITTTIQLIDRASAAADMHDQFVTPNQWMNWATVENLALALLLARSGWTQNVKTQTITVNGSEAGAFPLDEVPLAIAAVHQVRDSRLRALNYNNVVDFLRQIPGTPVVSGDPTEFRVLRDLDNDRCILNFYPEPPAGTVLLVSYVPQPLPLSTGTFIGYATNVAYPMGWEERIVLGMARRALDKEESDSTAIQRQIRECESNIEEACWSRVLADNPQVRNSDANRRGWSRDLVLPSSSQWMFF